MAEPTEHDELEEQAERIRRIEEEAGLRPHADPVKAEFRGARRGYRIGTEFVSTLLTGVALGWIVDEFFGSAPWGILVLTLFGFGVGMFQLWLAMKADKGSGDQD